MRKIREHLSRDDCGASAVEYGLLIAGIAALIVIVVFAFGGMVSRVFSGSCGTVAAQISASGSSTCP